MGKYHIPSSKKALGDCYISLEDGDRVLDLGCFGFHQVKMARACGRHNLHHSGVDFIESTEPLPDGFIFKKANLNKEAIPFDNDLFHLIVASHIIEHMSDPIGFFGECARVCRPGGTIYIEAPSERSLFLPGMPFDHRKMHSLSFFDDPTHVSRPWTPQALHRLSKYYSLEPLRTGYIYGTWKERILSPYHFIKALIHKDGRSLEGTIWGLIGWCSYLIVRKPSTLNGKPNFTYYIPEDR